MLHTLQAQEIPVATMARRLRISRPTVYAYPRRTSPPSPKRPQFQSTARVWTPYVPYRIRRWHESGADSMQLWRETQARGYTHLARTVCRFITRLRRAADAGHTPEPQGLPYTRPQGSSARAVSFTIVCPAAKRSREAQTNVNRLCQMDADIARAHGLSEAFLTMLRERRVQALEAWMAEVTHSSIDELACFVRGLQDDLQAELTLEWSNGVTEGQIHRLKLVKRQDYGRAGLRCCGNASCKRPRHRALLTKANLKCITCATAYLRRVCVFRVFLLSNVDGMAGSRCPCRAI